MIYTPHAYQERAIKFGIERPCAGFFMDPGLGKTSTLLAIISILLKRGFIKHTLVVAPLRVVYSVWRQEVEKWDQFRHLDVAILHGNDKVRILNEDHDIYLINPEGLLWLHGTKRYDEFDVLVVDESTKFKHPNTRRFKAMRHMIPHFDRRYILTGTPAPNGLLDLFGQIYLLDAGATLGKYITRYKADYFEQNGTYNWLPREGPKKIIYHKLKPLVMRLDQKDYLKMPERVVANVRVNLPSAARAIYDQLENTFVADLKAGRIVAANAAVASSKLRQIASGGVYVQQEDTEDERGKRESEHLHSAKTEACVDLVEQFQGQPTIIAYDTHHDLERLRAAFGKDLPYIGGGVSTKVGQQRADQWNLGQLPILALHPASAAHGLNLQHGGCHVIWYSLTWDLEAYEQLIRRVWRQGQKRRVVFVYHLICNGTIDELILARLASKNVTQVSLLDALREHYLERPAVQLVERAPYGGVLLGETDAVRKRTPN